MHPKALRTGVVGPCTGFLLVLGLTACGTPFDYRHPGEVPEGPGMMTGEEGAVRFGDDESTQESQEESADTPAGRPADCACPEGRELEAYREFLRWKADAVGTPEYQEFQDWREWRREQAE